MLLSIVVNKMLCPNMARQLVKLPTTLILKCGNLIITRAQPRGRFGQNNYPREPKFALNWAQGEVGDRIFVKSFHKQAVTAISTIAAY